MTTERSDPHSLPVMNGRRFCAEFTTELRAAPTIRTLQINIGALCNLACRHCHVDSSPARLAPGDNMDAETADRVIEWALAAPTIETIDITGGSPEMNPHFRRMVETFRASGRQVIDRCNPTIITATDPRDGATYEWIPDFLAAHEVEVVASMPCYLESNVERQRGRGSYDASVDGLKRLNDVGYGRDPRLRLNLVFNPNGPQLPPPQDALADDYHRELRDRFGLEFNALWTITNMPIKRWRHELERDGQLEAYMQLLIDAFNADTIDGLMCRHQVSIDPQGRLYDCDFNQALGLPTVAPGAPRLWDITPDDLAQRRIATGDHCYGCTAGAGSSCGGALA